MKHILPLILFLGFAPLLAIAQKNGTISGKINTNDGKRLEGFNIYVPGTFYKTQSDKNGEYKLTIHAGKYQLVCTGVGYEKSVMPISIHPGQQLMQVFNMKTDRNTDLGEITVKAKSAITEVRESPFNVVALDAKASYNTTLDLAHMLNKASGVRIRETGGVGSDVAISLNGFTGRHVKVFMDGLPMQGFGSAFQLNNIPATMAERIEVYKGVVPIEFGADALGGVINIVTNQSANTYVDASYSYGSFNTHRTNVNIGHTTKNGLSAQFSAIHNYSDNDYPIFARIANYRTGNVPLEEVKVKRFNDQYESLSFVGKIGVVGKSWADRLFLGITAGKVDKGIQNGANLGTTMITAYGQIKSTSNTFQPTLSYDKRNLLTKGLSVRLTANYNNNSNVTVDTAAVRYNWLGEAFPQGSRGERRFSNNFIPQFINRNASTNANISYNLTEKHSISVNDVYSYFVRKPGAGLIIEEGDSSVLINRTNIKNVLGLSYRYRPKRNWNANIFAKNYYTRATGPENISTSNNSSTYVERTESFPAWGYGIASTYFIKDIQFKISAEKALRLPTDNELFGDEQFEFGNLSLKPETSYNLNFGFVMNKEFNRDNTIYVDVNTYYRQIKDYIMRYVEERFPTGVSINHGKARNIGIDAEVRYYYKNLLTLGGTISRMDFRDREKTVTAGSNATTATYNSRMPNVPYFFGNVDAGYFIHHLLGKGNTLNLGYSLNFIDQFFLRPESLGQRETKSTLPRQLYHDLIATYMIKDGRYNLTFEAKDITNVRLFDNFGLEKPGRAFNIKFRYYFMQRRKDK